MCRVIVPLTWVFFQCAGARRDPHSLPTRRSSDLRWRRAFGRAHARAPSGVMPSEVATSDRKSTRLNSSHLGISDAVFCLKKETQHETTVYAYTKPNTVVTNRARQSRNKHSDTETR